MRLQVVDIYGMDHEGAAPDEHSLPAHAIASSAHAVSCYFWLLHAASLMVACSHQGKMPSSEAAALFLALLKAVLAKCQTADLNGSVPT